MKSHHASRNANRLIFLFYAVPLCLLGCLAGLFWGIGQLEYLRWKNSTSPLPSNVQVDLCEKLQLSQDNPLCTGETVLAPRFYPEIKNFFSSGGNSYEEVQDVLGNYYWKSEDGGQVSPGRTYYRVYYDLRGDGKYAVVFSFYKYGDFIQLQEYYDGMD